MFLRNLIIVALFAPGAAIVSAIPLLAMSVATVGIVLISRTRDEMPKKEFPLPSPVSLKSILLFGLIFLVIEVGGTMASRFIGQAGYVIVGFIGGLISSASTTAAAASAFAKGQTTTNITALAVTLASVASVLVNLPIVFRKVSDTSVSRRLSIDTAIIIATGFVALALTHL